MIIDTAGRLHVDDERMDEVERIKNISEPSEILFVADGATGQDAVIAASAFVERLAFTGVVLTRLDSDCAGWSRPLDSGGDRRSHQVYRCQ